MTRKGWIYMGLAAALWGASYMFIKVALEDVSEAVIVCVRTALGALVLVPLALRVSGTVAALRSRWPWVLFLSCVQVIVPFALITFGERWVPSALTGILIASSPLFLALLAVRMDREERSTGWGLVGVLTGFAGVALLFGVDLSGDTKALIGGLMVVGAAASYAVAVLTVKKRFTGVPSVGVAAGTMVVSAVAYLPWALATLPPSVPSLDATLSLIALGAGGTGVAFFFFYALIAEYGPARASIVAYLAPAFAVVYGAALLGEAITVGTVAGMALILVGSWLGAQGRLPAWRGGRVRPVEAPVGRAA